MAILLAALVPSGCTSTTEPNEVAPRCEVATSACVARFEGAPGLRVPVYRSHALDHPDTLVSQALIVIHGSARNAAYTFETGVAVARDADALETTLILAPWFRTLEDGPEAGAPYWSSGGWKRGHLSVTGSHTSRVSSYAVLDRLLADIATPGRFPRLSRIVVAGHSAGGQVVHRLAAATALEGVPQGVDVRFVVANPSTYLYLGPERWQGDGFGAPTAGACPDYQGWHYGLEDLNSYMRARSLTDVRERLVQRDVRILLGTADTLTAQLDETCGAVLQGRRRLDRGRTLIRYMDAFFPGHGHVETLIGGVGHSSRDMFTAAAGRRALFDDRPVATGRAAVRRVDSGVPRL